MIQKLLFAVAILSGPLLMEAAACPCNEKKAPACSCAAGTQCPQACAPGAPTPSESGKKDAGKRQAPKKS